MRETAAVFLAKWVKSAYNVHWSYMDLYVSHIEIIPIQMVDVPVVHTVCPGLFCVENTPPPAQARVVSEK